jgi:tetratricopeptide (TPR) repeat protein
MARTTLAKASLAFQEARFDTAAALFRRAAVAFARWPGPAADAASDSAASAGEPPPLAQALGGLGNCLTRLGDHAGADRAFRESRALFERQPGRFPLQYAQLLNNHGVLMLDAGRLRDAEATHRQALALKRSILPPVHPSVAASLVSLAGVLGMRGHHAASESVYAEAVAMTRASLGPGHRRVVVPLLGQGLEAFRRGDPASAVAPLREALALARALDPARPRLVRRVAATLGTSLLALGRAAEAEPLLAEAVALESAGAEPDDPGAAPAALAADFERQALAGAALRARWATALEQLGRREEARAARRGGTRLHAGRDTADTAR